MAAPHYKTVLAQAAEYLPDAQFGLDRYFQIQAQAALQPLISTPGIAYFHRIHLFPSSVGGAGYDSRSLDGKINEISAKKKWGLSSHAPRYELPSAYVMNLGQQN